MTIARYRGRDELDPPPAPLTLQSRLYLAGAYVVAAPVLALAVVLAVIVLAGWLILRGWPANA